MTLEIGTRLGHYRILALLGRGGMAEVYRAVDERLDREVALKVLPPEFAWDPERVERFEREVRAAAKLSQPNIVTVFEFGQGEGQHFYTMGLMPGGDLKTRIRGHPEGMAPDEARRVAAAVARALDYAHRRGFVHRDVKPENVLFDEDDRPQLTDFGIARAMAEGTLTAAGMVIGSPHYMSPEQTRGLKVDGRSDLYSLGVVLYEMLTGQLPFQASDTFAVAYSHINDPPPDLPRELAGWQPLLDRLLAKSPDDRYSSAAELAQVLAGESLPPRSATRVMPAGRAVEATRRVGGAGTRPVEPAKPRRTAVAAVAGAVLALAVVGIGYLALRDTTVPELAPIDGGGGSGESGLAPERPRPVRPKRPPNPKPVPVLGGGAVLVVETTPAGAEVLVDGTAVGKTPLERSDIRAGVREVRLRHPHYETVRESDRRFADGRVVRIQRRLVRGRGALTVTVLPRQAWVEVQGKRLAESTPVTLEDLPAGAVEVKLGAREHRPLSVEIEIPKGGLARLERRLERIPYGSLTLALEPADARVTLPEVNQSYRPGVRLREGTYRVAVSKEGYGEATRAINVSGDTRVRIALEKAGPTAGESRVFDGIEFVWIPAGEFRMGSTSRHAESDERPVTRVRITRGFWLGKYEVTQRQWQAVMGNNPSRFKNCGGDCPVERVSWNDVQGFFNRLNGRSGRRRYRLPTEAEWEYAARAGTMTDTYSGNLTQPAGNDPVLNRIAWYDENSGNRTHPVGRKAPNGWGLHDMMGNVWEWVGDRYGDYPGGSVTDPTGARSGSSRVNRGGSLFNFARFCRSAFRSRRSPGYRSSFLGFRLLRK